MGWGLQRKKARVMTQISVDHLQDYFSRNQSAHLKRIGVSDTSLCECGHADQTPDHILQACPMYTEKRHQKCPNSVDLSSPDLRRTGGFAATLGLRIWWHGCRTQKKTKFAGYQFSTCAGMKTTRHQQETKPYLCSNFNSHLSHRRGLTITFIIFPSWG